jgi:hypothetical protein
MNRLTLFAVILLALLTSSIGWADPWIDVYYDGYDGYSIPLVDGATCRAYSSGSYINVYANGGGWPLPYYGGGMSYDLDGIAGDIDYTPTSPIYVGMGYHTLIFKYWQHHGDGSWVPVKTVTVHFTVAYPTPIAPTISSVGSTGGPAYHPVVSWNDIPFDGVHQNTTNGYEIYRRDYISNTLWHDWSKKASVSGTVTTWTDQSIGGAPMGLDKVEYKVHAVDIAGQVGPYSNVGTTRVFFQYKIFAGGVPDQYSLNEGYPNPFNPSTHMQFDLPAPGNVSLLILDVQGREVQSLHSGFTEAGSYSITWNAADQATGVYFARLIVTDQSGKAVYTKTNKLLLTK